MTSTDEKLEAIERRIIAQFEDIFELFGLNRALGTISGQLNMHAQGLSMSELSKHTGYSLSSLSPYLKNLELLGFVKKRKVDGRIRYFCPGSFYEFFNGFMKSLLEKEITPMLEILKESDSELKKLPKSKKVEEMKKTMIALKEEYQFAKDAISLKLFYHDKIPIDKVKKHFAKMKKFSDKFVEMINES